MALRVLLADESSTIKKVFQLALQDFAVDVRPVNIGIDVLKVAQSFKPDIIFADVLLQKKNGYEVSAELKQDAQMKATPVVLMWSGFMEFDEDKFGASLANASLEKPFDVAALRKLITDLVPRTKDQRLSQFLTFPQPPAQDASAPPPGAEELPDLAPAEEFKHISIPKMKSATAAATAAGGPPPVPAAKPAAPKAAPTGADKFRLNLSAEELDPTHIPVQYEVPAGNAGAPETPAEPEELDLVPSVSIDFGALRQGSHAPQPQVQATSPSIRTPKFEELAGPDDVTPNPGPPKAPTAAAGGGIPALSEEQLEAIVRSQSAAVIESVVWKVIPELATQIIERELKKLLSERDAF